jgi:hypothetical protein
MKWSSTPLLLQLAMLLTSLSLVYIALFLTGTAFGFFTMDVTCHNFTGGN